MPSSNEIMVLLKSSEGKNFLVNYGVTIAVADTLKNIVGDACVQNSIPVPDVRGEILEKVIRYRQKYHEQQIWPVEYAKASEPLLLDIRQKLMYLSHCPIHFRAPAKIFWRIIRGMVPHKTKREAAARYKVYEGIPPPYDKIKRMVIPGALAALRLQPRDKYRLVRRLSSEVRWSHAATIKELEEKRLARSKLWLKAEKISEHLGAQLEILFK